jgi:selenocysteine lyase/cysteine desulfurase
LAFAIFVDPKQSKVPDRRSFLKKLSALTAAGLTAPALSVFAKNDEIKFDGIDWDKIPPPDDVWTWVRMQFSASPAYVYLNNAGVSPSPKVVRDAWYRMMEMANEAPSHTLWRVLEAGRDNIKKRLADLLNCTADELTVVRNATEALSIIVNQIKLTKGDEIVLTKYDYPRMISVWEQKEREEGIKLNYVDLVFPENDEQKIVDKFVAKFTKNTKVVYLTHMINWTGQMLPVAKIAAEAKKKGITVILDPTQSFGQTKVDLTEFQCDFAGMSAHKWLHGPIGTGILFVKKDRILDVPSYFSPNPKFEKTMLKFDDHGTRNSTAELALAHTLDFHEYITLERKIERLNYLKNYWLDQVKNHPNIIIYTPSSTNLSGALVTIGFKNVETQVAVSKLFTDDNVIVATCTIHDVSGMRISPSIYNNEYELDILVARLLKILNNE